MKTAQEILDQKSREDAAMGLVRQLREDLLDAGYRHANAAGEIVSEDGTTWVSTTYTHGEYSVYAWRRPRGHGELGEHRVVMRVTPITEPKDVTALTNRLKLWAKRPRRGAQWPPRGMGEVR